MQNSNDGILRDIIKEMLTSYHLESKLDETKIMNAWDKVVGKVISKHTKKLYIKRQKLFAVIDSPALKNELNYSREKIKQLLNKEVGKEVIKEIIFN